MHKNNTQTKTHIQYKPHPKYTPHPKYRHYTTLKLHYKTHPTYKTITKNAHSLHKQLRNLTPTKINPPTITKYVPTKCQNTTNNPKTYTPHPNPKIHLKSCYKTKHKYHKKQLTPTPKNNRNHKKLKWARTTGLANI